MKLKLFVAMSLFAAIPIVTQAQQKGHSCTEAIDGRCAKTC